MKQKLSQFLIFLILSLHSFSIYFNENKLGFVVATSIFQSNLKKNFPIIGQLKNIKEKNCGILINSKITCKFIEKVLVQKNNFSFQDCLSKNYNLMRNENTCNFFISPSKKVFEAKNLIVNLKQNVFELKQRIKQLNLKEVNTVKIFNDFSAKTLRELFFNIYHCRNTPKKIKEEINLLGNEVNKGISENNLMKKKGITEFIQKLIKVVFKVPLVPGSIEAAKDKVNEDEKVAILRKNMMGNSNYSDFINASTRTIINENNFEKSICDEDVEEISNLMVNLIIAQGGELQKVLPKPAKINNEITKQKIANSKITKVHEKVNNKEKPKEIKPKILNPDNKKLFKNFISVNETFKSKRLLTEKSKKRFNNLKALIHKVINNNFKNKFQKAIKIIKDKKDGKNKVEIKKNKDNKNNINKRVNSKEGQLILKEISRKHLEYVVDSRKNILKQNPTTAIYPSDNNSVNSNGFETTSTSPFSNSSSKDVVVNKSGNEKKKVYVYRTNNNDKQNEKNKEMKKKLDVTSMKNDNADSEEKIAKGRDDKNKEKDEENNNEDNEEDNEEIEEEKDQINNKVNDNENLSKDNEVVKVKEINGEQYLLYEDQVKEEKERKFKKVMKDLVEEI